MQIMLYKARASPFIVPKGEASNLYWTVDDEVSRELNR